MNEQDENIIGDNLTAKQERFCINYTQNYELFSNATSSYSEAYDIDLENANKLDAVYEFKDGTLLTEQEINDRESDDYNIKKGKKITISTYEKLYDYCSKAGSRLRKSGKIQARCRELLNEFMNDKVIDARLTEIIIDGASQDSINAIKEYNKLRQRIVDKKDITSGGKAIDGFNFIRAEENK